jgi:hypothetical protein
VLFGAVGLGDEFEEAELEKFGGAGPEGEEVDAGGFGDLAGGAGAVVEVGFVTGGAVAVEVVAEFVPGGVAVVDGFHGRERIADFGLGIADF